MGVVLCARAHIIVIMCRQSMKFLKHARVVVIYLAREVSAVQTMSKRRKPCDIRPITTFLAKKSRPGIYSAIATSKLAVEQ